MSVTGDKDGVFLTAGRAGSGKSTALNNIFDMEFDTGMSAVAVTTKVTKITSTKFQKGIPVIDTPGLEDVGISEEVIVKEMKEAVGDRDYTLLYCFNIGPGRRVDPEDKRILKLLKTALTSKVWSKMVIVFTFSDKIRRQNFQGSEKNQNYKDYIIHFTKILSKALKDIDSTAPAIKSIFEFKGETITRFGKHLYNREEDDADIVAIPVEGVKESVRDVLPDIIPQGSNWTYLVFMELLRKTRTLKLYKFIALCFGEAFGSKVASELSTQAQSSSDNRFVRELGALLGKAKVESDLRKLHVQLFSGMILAEEEQRCKKQEEDKQLIF